MTDPKIPIAVGVKLINFNAWEATGETETELVIVNLTDEQKEFLLSQCKEKGLSCLDVNLIFPNSFS